MVTGAVLAIPLLFGLYAGWQIRTRKALRDTHRLVNYFEGLLHADLVQQHVYLDPEALIYAALQGRNIYVGMTTQPLEKRIYQHGRGTSGFDRIYSRDPESWTWIILEAVPTTYRFAAEKAWIARYKTMSYTLMNGNDGTDDGQRWEIADAA